VRPRPTSSSRNSRKQPSTSWTATTGSIHETRRQALKKKVEAQGQFFTYEVYLNYSATLLLADAIERAKSSDRAKIIEALGNSTFAGHVMPYGPTKFVNGQNQGAAPANTQVIDGDIQVVLPEAFASAKPVYPMPRT
jgi:branched-chain amino acid transport system substrate-binding protein